MQRALNQSGQAILATRDLALESIRAAGSAASGEVSSHLEESVEKADRVLATAERLQHRVTAALAGRLAIAVTPFAVTLLMFFCTAWSVIHAYQWVFEMDHVLWLRIVTGIALTGAVAGALAGLWWLALQARRVLMRSR
ncbi:hypothetical protein I8D64_11650 [Brachybacterium sp. MASK1Z-5]|uniref:Phage holin family protein n=1 Tax=Brachybacterium halotolerans TaxID=2795215 RepID=A0ABS1BBN2_9MICO|nr:hypothetical protein [Brachybacterium halotolerans]MBK0332053.1 hypothetical protein [Brachybacterium halotolerans]